MTGRYEEIVKRLSQGPDPLDDPLVAAWDAVVRGEQAAPAGSDPADTAVLRRFHTLESIPSPSYAFIGDLEQQLSRLAPQPAARSSRSVTGSALGSKRASLLTPTSIPWSGQDTDASSAHAGRSPHSVRAGATRQLISMRAAAALLTLLLIVGSIALYSTRVTPPEPPAIPAAVIAPPAMETLLQLDFAPLLWDLPGATTWNHAEFSMFTVAPDTSFSTAIPWYTQIDGPLMIVALSGDLIVRPVGTALVYRNGSSSSTPVESPAGEPVILRPNEAIVYSSLQTATGSNPGSEPVRALYGLAGVATYATPGSAVDARDISRVDINYIDHIAPLPGDGASVFIQHLELAPLDTFVYEFDYELRIAPVFVPMQINELRIYDGALEGLPPDLGANAAYASLAQLESPSPGPHTLINIGDETVDLYFLVVEPYPDTATPPA